jgi:hypothetical protein
MQSFIVCEAKNITHKIEAMLASPAIFGLEWTGINKIARKHHNSEEKNWNPSLVMKVDGLQH